MSFHLLVASNGKSANEVVQRDWKIEPLGEGTIIASRILEHFPSAHISGHRELEMHDTSYSVHFDFNRDDDQYGSSKHPFDYVVDSLTIVVTGDAGNPILDIVSFCKRNGWFLADFQNDSWVDLDNPKTAWDEYQTGRANLANE